MRHSKAITKRPSDFEIEPSPNESGYPDISKALDYLFVRHAMVLPGSALKALQADDASVDALDEEQLSDRLFAQLPSISPADRERRTYLVKAMLDYVRARRALSDGNTDAAWSSYASARYWEGKADGDYEAWAAIERKRKGAAASAQSKAKKKARLKEEVLRNLGRLAPTHGWRDQNQAMKAIAPALKDFVDHENSTWLRQQSDNLLHVWLYEDMEVIAAFNSTRSGTS